MIPENKDKFCLIGNGQLLLDCVEIILSQNHKVLALISTDPKVISWISKYNSKNSPQIQIFSSLRIFQDSFYQSFDYLFSIINYSLIPKAILQMPKHGVFNYHAGILPEFRGVYGTSWAILNQQSKYGITWHKVDEGIDTGPKLLEREVILEPEDTAYSLEIKCATQAKETFPELLALLQQDTLAMLIQDNVGAHQYTFNDKLPNNGLINWNQDAEEILRLYRASVMSDSTPNYLGIVKFMLLGEIYTASRVLKTKTVSTIVPGSIITTKNNYLEIATKTTNVILEDIFTLKGNPVHVNKLLKDIPLDAHRLEFHSAIAKSLEHPAYSYANERFWAEQLIGASPLIYPGSAVSIQNGSNFNFSNTISYPVMNLTLLEDDTNDKEIICIMALFILFNALSPHRRSTVGFVDFNFATSSAENLFLANKVPFTLEIDKLTTLGELRQKVQLQLSYIRKHGRYPYDLIIRHPVLKDIPTDLPISFEIVDNNETTTEISDSVLHFVFNRMTGEVSIFYYPSLLSDTHFLNELPGFLKNIVTNISFMEPVAEIGSIDIMTAPQKQKLISKIPTALKSSPIICPTDTIVTLFEQFSKNEDTKHRIALRYKENDKRVEITYEELSKRVDYLTEILCSKGVMTETPVMVACQKIEEFVISVLATLKAGGTFVPINPCDTPEEFFHQIFEDLGSPFIITDENSFAFLPQELVSDKTVINASGYKTVTEHNSTAFAQPDKNSLAYIIFTSGTQGKPKGVGVTHFNIMHSTACRIQYYQNEGEDFSSNGSLNILPILSLAFDAATGAMFWALCSGNTLHLLDSESKTADGIASYIKQNNITHFMSNPSTYNALLNQAEKARENFEILNAVILGGEKWDSTIVQQHKRVAPNASLYDEYGPTENTVWTTVKKVSKKNSFGKHPHPQVTIGHVLSPDMKVYVLNKEQKPVPAGVIGELYVSGPQVARGYINRYELTVSKFTKLNLAKVFGDSSLPIIDVYRTGDLVRYTSQFELDFVGRIDDEAKVNGHRVDLSGINGALKKNPNIQDARVLVSQNKSNTNCELIAYVVTALPYSIENVSHMQEFLSHQLPNYMIPRKFIFISELPITRNGKVDKTKLLNLPFRRPSAAIINNLKPENAIENELVSLWAEILNIDSSILPVDANLHDYGLKSISIPQARVKIFNIFHINLTLSEFFTYPTIREQATIINQRKTRETTEQTVLITGTTGFLGLHLLLDVIKNTNYKVLCLIRGNKQQQPIQKLFLAMQHFGYDVDLLNHGRVTVVEGDISKPFLGLEQDEYRKLAGEIDCIYHCAAHVNHILPYSQLQAINVTGTQNVIDFALTGKNKRLHYVSTLSVSQPKEDFICEEDTFELSGYAKSKRESEKLLSVNRTNGLRVTIYRPGWIGGHSQSGKFLEPQKDHLLCLTHACIQMGYAPQWSMTVDVLPVDIVSKIITSISLISESENQVYNIFNPKGIPWSNYSCYVENVVGKQIQIISNDEWMRKLKIEFLYKGFPLQPFKELYLAHANWLTEQEIQPPFSFENTFSMLDRLGIQILPITLDLIKKYIDNNFIGLDTSNSNESPLSRGQGLERKYPSQTITNEVAEDLWKAMQQIVLIYQKLGGAPEDPVASSNSAPVLSSLLKESDIRRKLAAQIFVSTTSGGSDLRFQHAPAINQPADTSPQ